MEKIMWGILKLDKFFDLVHNMTLQTVVQTHLEGRDEPVQQVLNSLTIKHLLSWKNNVPKIHTNPSLDLTPTS